MVERMKWPLMADIVERMKWLLMADLVESDRVDGC